MTSTLDVELCTPVDLAASPSLQYIKIDEVMDVCSRLGALLAVEAIHSDETRGVIIAALMRLVEHGPPLERIILYEIANNMIKADPLAEKIS